jgi:galactose-1-phosphate uridylyltransferase
LITEKDDFILHLPFWNSFPWEVNSFPWEVNSFPWEVNSFPELQNIKESEAVYCF